MQQKWNQNFDGEPMTDIPQKFLNAGCDVYMVMQLRHDEKILDERFASMRELHRRGKTPDPEHYEVTYYADLPAMWQDVPNNEILEELFQMFNLSRPQDFEGHSLSVSD
ncbi:YodL domain-containing protein, partial [Faecalibacterium duncaniae]